MRPTLENYLPFMGRRFTAAHRLTGKHTYTFVGVIRNEPAIKRVARGKSDAFTVSWDWFDTTATGRKIEWLPPC